MCPPSSPTCHPDRHDSEPEPAQLVARTDPAGRGSRRVLGPLSRVCAFVAVLAIAWTAVVSGSAYRAEATVSVLPGATGQGCAPGVGVTVVVDFGSMGGIAIGCAPGQQSTGLDALAAAGFSVTPGLAAGTVCTVDSLPSEGYPYCWITGGFWSYWKKSSWGLGWTMSPAGPAAGPLPIDSVEGWYWAQGFRSQAPGGDESTAPPTTTTTTTTTTATVSTTTSGVAVTVATSVAPTEEPVPGSGGAQPTLVPSQAGPEGPATAGSPEGGVESEATAAPAPGAGRVLARTGSDVGQTLMVGLLLLTAGLAVAMASRRRTLANR